MGASARPAEQFADSTGVPAGDRYALKRAVVLGNRRAGSVRIRLEGHLAALDHEGGETDLHLDDHVMHDDRVGIMGDVEAGGFLIAHPSPDEDSIGGESIRPHAVLAVVDRLESSILGEDVVSIPGGRRGRCAHPVMFAEPRSRHRAAWLR